MSKVNNQKTTCWVWLAVVALMLSGCAGIWETAPHQLSAAQWSLTPPEGWMHLNTIESDMLSKDGPYLEYILVQSRPLDQKFHFTRKKMNTKMLPHEAARLITDNIRSDTHIRQFRLLSSEPAMVGGHPGFKLAYTHQDQMGVEIKTVYYGVVLQDMFFNLRYSAARRHYFDCQLPAFDGVVQSLQFASDLKPSISGAHASQTLIQRKDRG
jgi:hypothetical protein